MDERTQEQVLMLPLSQLHPFKNHPFQVREDALMEEMKDSIQAQGVLVPCIARLRSDGEYEIISGHRRHYASGIVGLHTMPWTKSPMMCGSISLRELNFWVRFGFLIMHSKQMQGQRSQAIFYFCKSVKLL